MSISLDQELAQLRAALATAEALAGELPGEVSTPQLNPSLSLYEASRRGLPALLEAGGKGVPEPEQGAELLPELLLVWYDPRRGRAVVKPADNGNLLALKLAEAGLQGAELRQAGREAGIAPARLHATLEAAAAQGLVLLPAAKLAREADFCTSPIPDTLRRARTFTLQWHITQACDLHCKHCYDRSSRAATRLDDGLALLDQLAAFCDARHVQGQVSFSGGNPFLHPDFMALYAAAVERGFVTVVLGNPVERRRLEALCAIAPPAAYQVSLEGLTAHNDAIRGPGHFARTLEFLELLRELAIPSLVMLTLTRANQDQVLDLAKELRGLAGQFTFTRLSPFGEGAALACAEVAGYPAFLHAYLDAAAGNTLLGLKDGLFNPALEKRGEALCGGCTGYGCGAAFSYLAVLPDGEVHACRKFPSLVGDLRQSDLAAIYDGPAARAYRLGSAACRECALKPRCGGCLAVTAGSGLDPLTDRDPYCFRKS